MLLLCYHLYWVATEKEYYTCKCHLCKQPRKLLQPFPLKLINTPCLNFSVLSQDDSVECLKELVCGDDALKQIIS